MNRTEDFFIPENEVNFPENWIITGLEVISALQRLLRV